MQPDQDAIVTLGKINGVFGVQGWVKIYSFTERQDAIFDYKPWFLAQGKNQWQPVKLMNGQRQGKGLIAKLEGINNRDDALSLRDASIGVARDMLPTLPDEQYYWSDLTGLTVLTVQGQALGKISHLFETGSNDVMVVVGERERLLPWIMGDVVKEVDLALGQVRVDWDPEF